MERSSEKQKSARQSSGGGSLWGIGIYLCLAAALISLIFASCTGGAVYNPKDQETGTPTPALNTVAPENASPVPEEGTSPSPEADPSPSPSAAQ